ncbi:hypothetical protein PMIN06_013095 [Paraphaeosphaeria minitans]|uniref:Uncharacterized protein n=1 Tax=Paraphaeosphaeria minitans TaxID=565426 RepID=A0A9P6G6B8_9PLEO|nr:hypothetical protein PMIN01_12538 [Paraphaeosphaeria minitans]
MSSGEVLDRPSDCSTTLLSRRSHVVRGILPLLDECTRSTPLRAHIYPLIALAHSQTVAPSLARILAIDTGPLFQRDPSTLIASAVYLMQQETLQLTPTLFVPNTTTGNLAWSTLGQKSCCIRGQMSTGPHGQKSTRPYRDDGRRTSS